MMLMNRRLPNGTGGGVGGRQGEPAPYPIFWSFKLCKIYQLKVKIFP
jgi:hypothetical protein